ncbi:MAG: hypothetical protein K8823_1245 [Cenarchaeum symbiont of Oopsacas minuta]|nr:hypothetical protein [Cenarchaeum symbiont of Oopsacas minuta]
MITEQRQLWQAIEGRMQLKVPIYQRKYSWKRIQCEQLWTDIINAAEDAETLTYFIGTVVYVAEPTNPGDVPCYNIIDGQQRLTSISLLLTALSRSIKNTECKIAKEEIDGLLLNIHRPQHKHKLILTQTDENTLKCIIDNESYPKDYSIILKNNFEYFEGMVEKTNLELIYRGIQKLSIVQITLDAKDNSQLIFESLNSTGLALSKTDLIRNYILMDLESREQFDIYTNYWQPMENNFDNYAHFDEFMKDYLIIKNHKVIKIEDIYAEFKKYHKQEKRKKTKIEELVKDLKYHSEFFTKLLYDKKESDLELQAAIRSINELNANVVRPFLLKILVYHDDNLIQKESVLEIFSTIESYLLRRAVCNLHREGLNQILPRLIKKMDELVDNNSEEIKGLIFGMLKDGRRFPDDDEFHKEFMAKNMYNTKILKYILCKFENHERKINKEYQKISYDDPNYQKEHIMPQNYNAWKDELNAADLSTAEKHVHQIGNLTLTGYNQKLGDKSFQDKLNMSGGFKQSPLLLNRFIATFTQWNTKEIQSRSSKLATIACKIWKREKPSQEILNKYIPNNIVHEYTEEEYFDGEHTPNEIPNSTRNLFDDAKNRILEEFLDIIYKPKKAYCVFYLNDSPVCSLRVLKTCLKINYNTNENPSPNSSFVKHLIDKNGKVTGHLGTGDYESTIKDNEDIEHAVSLIKKKIINNID